jgi:hypothetical protein
VARAQHFADSWLKEVKGQVTITRESWNHEKITVIDRRRDLDCWYGFLGTSWLVKSEVRVLGTRETWNQEDLIWSIGSRRDMDHWASREMTHEVWTHEMRNREMWNRETLMRLAHGHCEGSHQLRVIEGLACTRLLLGFQKLGESEWLACKGPICKVVMCLSIRWLVTALVT